MVFENGIKNIQAAAYNGAHTVERAFQIKICKVPTYLLLRHSYQFILLMQNFRCQYLTLTTYKFDALETLTLRNCDKVKRKKPNV